MHGPMDGGFARVSNQRIAAGYTYFFQFVAHDLTTDASAPSLSLKTVYGPNRTPLPRLCERNSMRLLEGRRSATVPAVSREPAQEKHSWLTQGTT